MFFTKAPQVWTDGDDGDHLRYVAEVLMAQGWPQPEIIAEDTRAEGVMGLFGGKGDPFSLLWLRNLSSNTSTFLRFESMDVVLNCGSVRRAPGSP